jgi:hypothetical protein
VERFFKRDHDVSFHVTAPFRFGSPSPKTAPANTAPTPSATKKCLEEIAESSATEFEFNPSIPRPIAIESSTWLLSVPPRWGLKSARLVPIRAKLIVLFALLRIPEDFVGLVDLFEFFLGRRFVFVDIWMVFARKFPKSFADLVVARRLRDP